MTSVVSVDRVAVAVTFRPVNLDLLPRTGTVVPGRGVGPVVVGGNGGAPVAVGAGAVALGPTVRGDHRWWLPSEVPH